MNKSLTTLYSSKWNGLIAAVKQEQFIKKPAHPLLIKVSDKYIQAKVKVLIVGQETDGWGKKGKDFATNPSNVDELQSGYYQYLFEYAKKWNRPFWNRANFRFFDEQLKKHFNNDVCCVWSNLSKIGKDGRGKTTDQIADIENKYFAVHLDELEILKPNIIIFNTGHSRDDLLKSRFNAEFTETNSPYKKKQIAQVKFAGPNENILGYRTYHPNFRQGVKDRKNRNKAIIDLIESNFIAA
jgi:hypothetical protein